MCGIACMSHKTNISITSLAQKLLVLIAKKEMSSETLLRFYKFL